MVDTRYMENRLCFRTCVMDGVVERESCRWEMGRAEKNKALNRGGPRWAVQIHHELVAVLRVRKNFVLHYAS